MFSISGLVSILTLLNVVLKIGTFIFNVAPPPMIKLSPSTYPSVAQLKLLKVPMNSRF